jgi:hypothetical protein
MSIWHGDTSKKARLDVEDAGGKRLVVEYLPVGGKLVVPQYRLDAAAVARDRPACLAWFFPPG